jgi:two-component system LytT family sensor kinase
MRNYLFNKKNINHFCFWILFTIYSYIVGPPPATLFIQIICLTLMTLSYVFIYYTELHLIFPKYYAKKLLLFVSIVSLFVSFLILNFFILIKFFDAYCSFNIFSGMPLKELIAMEFVFFSLLSFMALSSYQNKIGIDKLKLKSEKEKILLIKELGVLKNKFNSHITFNFLNHCYSKIHKDSHETAQAIEIFSRMLRYSLNNKAQEKVQLKGEIEYIEDFIKLQKLLSTDVMVNLSVKGDGAIYILPRILIGFVENAFKHGDLHSADHPISMELNTTEEYLNFTVTNKKNKHKIIEPSGIGNYNMKQQLELLYKNKYMLTISDEDTIYSTHLKLQLT